MPIALDVYRSSANRCRALADQFRVGDRGRIALLEVAEQWDLLAILAERQSDPAYSGFAVDFPPPPLTLKVIKNGVRARPLAEMHELAFTKLTELGDHIEWQWELIARLEEGSEAWRTANSVLTSYMQLRDTLLSHILRMTDEPPPSVG